MREIVEETAQKIGSAAREWTREHTGGGFVRAFELGDARELGADVAVALTRRTEFHSMAGTKDGQGGGAGAMASAAPVGVFILSGEGPLRFEPVEERADLSKIAAQMPGLEEALDARLKAAGRGLPEAALRSIAMLRAHALRLTGEGAER